MTKKDYVALAAPEAIKALFKAKESEAPQDVNVYYGLNGAPADIPLGTFKTFPKGEEI